MTKQPVVGTIIVGILVTLIGLWGLALALDLSVIEDFSPTNLLIGTLLVLAVLLIVVAAWPRPSAHPHAAQFSPVTAEQARAGISAGAEGASVDLRWLEPAEPITVPVTTPGHARLVVEPAGLAIRTSASDIDIDPALGIIRSGSLGRDSIFLGPGVADLSQALVTVVVTASAVSVRPH